MVVEQAENAMFIVDARGRYQDVNLAGCEMLGYSREELLGMSISDVVANHEASRVESEIASRLAGERTTNEWELVRKNGSTFRAEVRAIALSDHRLLGIVHDITERQRLEELLRESFAELGLPYQAQRTHLAGAVETISAELANRGRVEQALRESQSRLSAVVSTAAEGIITINQRGIIDSFNPAAERIFGYSASEVIGKDVSVLMPPPYADNHARYLSNYAKTGEKKVIGIGREVVGKRKNGTTFPMDLAVGEGMDRSGPIFTGIVRDLTSRKESENRLRTAERLSAIGTLAAGLGHDMNNVLLPVRARLSALRAAAESGTIKPAERRHTEAISKSVAYLQQLADGLHFLAMDPDSDDADDIHTDLHMWWAQTGALLAKAVPKGAKVSASIPAGLPAVRVAPHQLTQAVLNLLVNSGEAIPPARKRPEGRVKVIARAANDAKHGPCVRLSVTDNGQGMSEEVRRRAFDMFFTTKARGMGTGLGLPLVRKVADRSGGAVEIESTFGKGTTITMILVTRREADQPGTKRRKGLTAAICMNDGRAASLIRHLLAASGASAEVCEDLAKSDIVVVEPDAKRLPKVTKWRAQRPRGKLVLFGDPDHGAAARWEVLRPITIHDRSSLDAVRAALNEAFRTHETQSMKRKA